MAESAKKEKGSEKGESSEKELDQRSEVRI